MRLVRIKTALAAAIAMAAAGCAGAATEAARGTVAKATYDKHIDAAQKGDKEAQFKVGEALCCSVDDSAGVFYNTQRSVEWLCKSAAQGYGPAMYKLARIYSGDTVDGIRVMRRVANKVAGQAENIPVSYAWFSLANDHGFVEGAKHAADLWHEMNAQDRELGRKLAGGGTPCLWKDVFPSKA